MLREDQSQEDGSEIARQLMQALEIWEEDLIEGAYADLLTGLGLPALPSVMSRVGAWAKFPPNAESFLPLAINDLRHPIMHILPGTFFFFHVGLVQEMVVS